MKTLIRTVLILKFIFISFSCRAIEHEEIMAALNSLRQVDNATFTFQVHNQQYIDGKIHKENKLKVYYKSPKNVLISFLEPKRDVGRKILIDQDNMWISFPRTKHHIRISPNQRLIGEASNGDVVNLNYDEYTIAITEVVDNDNRAYRLNLKKKDRKAIYDEINMWLKRDSLKPYRSEHFGVSGKLLKVAEYQSFIKCDGQEFLHQVKLYNPIFSNKYTLMSFTDYQKADIPDRYFVKS